MGGKRREDERDGMGRRMQVLISGLQSSALTEVNNSCGSQDGKESEEEDLEGARELPVNSHRAALPWGAKGGEVRR